MKVIYFGHIYYVNVNQMTISFLIFFLGFGCTFMTLLLLCEMGPRKNDCRAISGAVQTIFLLIGITDFDIFSIMLRQTENFPLNHVAQCNNNFGRYIVFK